MKLAVSNIAWAPAEDAAVIELLITRGIKGVEIAPTMIWPGWEGMSESAASTVAERYARHGLEIPALQAILYGRSDLQLLGDKGSVDALVTHVGRVAGIARHFGAGVLVFGSPKNRDPGGLTPQVAWRQAVDVFRRLGEVCAAEDVVLGIEANPPAYGCNFLTRWSEAAELVREVEHAGVKLHLDVACTVMAGDDPAQALKSGGEIIRHVHISEPQLTGFAAPEIDHAAFGAALAHSHYQGWLSIEMRRADESLPAIDQAIAVTMANYPSVRRG